MPDGVTLSKSEGIVRSASETERLAFELSEVARIGDLLCLSGDLGVGKTTFARAFIRARGWRMGVEMDDVPSPTFTLAQVYELPGRLLHRAAACIQPPDPAPPHRKLKRLL